MQFPGVENILHAAAFDGDWNAVEVLLQKNPPPLLNMSLNLARETALHIASRENRKKFVEKLVTHLSRDDLALQTTNEDTALCIAAIWGFMDIAKIMIGTNLINESDLQQSLIKAVKNGRKKMAWYLFSHTLIGQLEDKDRISLFVATVMREMYDMALKILKKYQNVALRRDDGQSNLTALHVLVQNPQEIFNGSGVGTAVSSIWSWTCGKACKSTVAYQLLKRIWYQVLTLQDKEILEFIQATPNVFFEAVKFGNVKFVTLFVESYLKWKVEKVDEQLLRKPILHRQGKIFNLIYKKVGAFKDYVTNFIDADGNNMLHLAGKLPMVEELGTPRPNLRMEQELYWFKEMQKIMSPQFTKRRNYNGLTPEDVFLKEHEDLIIQSRTAIKSTAGLYLAVSIAILAIVVAAAFVVPGSSHGSPKTVILHEDTWFRIFIVSNAVALSSCTASMTMSLLILSSGFVESEYITSLRVKTCEVIALRISITSVVIAFTAAVFLMFDHKSAWVPYLTALLASFPVILTLLLQYKHYKLGMWLA